MASATEELDDVKEKLAKIELRQGGTKTKKAIQDLSDTLHRKLNDIKKLIAKLEAESDKA